MVWCSGPTLKWPPLSGVAILKACVNVNVNVEIQRMKIFSQPRPPLIYGDYYTKLRGRTLTKCNIYFYSPFTINAGANHYLFWENCAIAHLSYAKDGMKPNVKQNMASCKILFIVFSACHVYWLVCWFIVDFGSFCCCARKDLFVWSILMCFKIKEYKV